VLSASDCRAKPTDVIEDNAFRRQNILHEAKSKTAVTGASYCTMVEQR
jgi:hypothetical protein